MTVIGSPWFFNYNPAIQKLELAKLWNTSSKAILDIPGFVFFAANLGGALYIGESWPKPIGVR